MLLFATTALGFFFLVPKRNEMEENFEDLLGHSCGLGIEKSFIGLRVQVQKFIGAFGQWVEVQLSALRSCVFDDCRRKSV